MLVGYLLIFQINGVENKNTKYFFTKKMAILKESP